MSTAPKASTSHHRRPNHHQQQPKSQRRPQPQLQESEQPETTTTERDTDTQWQPKLAFANERTFLAWIHFTVLLGGVAVGIANFSHSGTGTGTGDMENDLREGSPVTVTVTMLSCLAIAIMLYALFTHNRRASTIRRGIPPESVYVDRMGPTLVLAAFIAVFVVNVILRDKEFGLGLEE
ncbi:hypothetical protein D9758_002877 [Tetrapyrgos nigripes]|uniref:DUF202 domain-containing protein n=1 Tax=Tetrapyrgos nigripes TaxID=182062 RepID=A0A8H5GPY6_9AGAR|nr:hypothetical protein D9758_002877 [Tetrapyrgos nigripes]